MDQFKEIEAFVAVAQLGSFVKAADKLGLSKAMVSRQVSELEARLGVRLMQRSTRRLSLSDAGAEYLQRCVQILAELADANAAVSAGAVQAQGLLKITAPVTFGIRHLAPLWGEFLRVHPRVELEVNLNDRVVDLIEEGYGLAVRIGQLASSTLVARRIASARLLLCASPRYLQQAAPIRELADLVQHDVIAYSYLATGEQWHFSGPEGARSITVHPRLRSNSGDTCRAAALADQGVVFQPGFLVGEDLKAGRLVQILPQYAGPELDISVVYASRQHLSHKVRAMVEFLATAFAQAGRF
ncbi:MAG: LysR family transcriptional regulator [Hylemonella sp.]|uniref:LysR family transcriptional regulator n=1 Tax=Hylemonella sp. TaxID=2066020 RepID=UPI0022C874E0|nr:LysR family transcriptional regulator [Hylemonella sp.]MCZ8253637.1 LysR family transcriptional regulator [Hylemonella sp.]